MAFLNSRTRACAWGIETGLGDAVVLKLFPCTCSIRTEVAMPDLAAACPSLVPDWA